MSTQVGIVKLEGKIDGVSFYRSGGKYLARMANGPDKKRIKRDPAFRRTRENNLEFGGAAKAASAFRASVSPVLKLADSRVTSRLIANFREINRRGEGERGKRPINLSQHRAQLANFDFNINLLVSSLFTGMVTAEHREDRLHASLKIEDVVISKVTNGPVGATHVRFTQLLGAVSDYVYDEFLEQYVPVKDSMDFHTVVNHSDYFSLKEKTPVSFALSSMLTGNPSLTDNASVIQCFGILFYQQVGNDFEVMKNGSAVKVLKIF
jgi:hypothetical protein